MFYRWRDSESAQTLYESSHTWRAALGSTQKPAWIILRDICDLMLYRGPLGMVDREVGYFVPKLSQKIGGRVVRFFSFSSYFWISKVIMDTYFLSTDNNKKLSRHKCCLICIEIGLKTVE